jgi:hypothetical protein
LGNRAIAAESPATTGTSLPGDNYNPHTGSPYWQLPASLRQTLGDTFVAIQDDNKDSEGHTPTDPGQLGLQGTFKNSCPSTFDALDKIPLEIVNLYRLIFDRVMGLSPAIWEQVIWIRWSWISTSMGFNVTYKDAAAAKSALNGISTSSNSTGRAVCFEDRMLSKYWHKDCDCWRELPSNPNDAKRDPEGLHLLVGDRPANPLADQFHIDPIDPYKFRDDDGTCKVSLDANTIAHLQQVFIPGHEIHSPFVDLPSMLRQVRLDLNSPWATGVDAEKKEVNDFGDSWAGGDDRLQACRGLAGWLFAQGKIDRLRAISTKLNPMRPTPAPAGPVRASPGPPPSPP